MNYCTMYICADQVIECYLLPMSEVLHTCEVDDIIIHIFTI